MAFLDWLIDRTRSVSRLAVWLAGGFMLFSVFYVGAEVLSRKTGIGRVTGATEVGGYMLATCSAWAFSFTLINRSNIRFDPFYWMGPAWLRAIFDLIALIAMGILAGVIAYYAYGVMQTSLRLGSRSSSGLPVPTWVPQAVWFSGFLFLCWTAIVLAIRSALALLMGDYSKISDLIGLEMANEEVERETHDAHGMDIVNPDYPPEEPSPKLYENMEPTLKDLHIGHHGDGKKRS